MGLGHAPLPSAAGRPSPLGIAQVATPKGKQVRDRKGRLARFPLPEASRLTFPCWSSPLPADP